jgi:hypothetical protein
MEIFERIFEQINDNDLLYFDITHGFRYLPMHGGIGKLCQIFKMALVKALLTAITNRETGKVLKLPS